MNKMVSVPVAAAAVPIAATALLAPEPAAATDSKLMALVEEYSSPNEYGAIWPTSQTK